MSESSEPDFVGVWEHSHIHPAMAWRLWWCAQVEGDDLRTNPEMLFDGDWILPQRVLRNFPEIASNPLWVELFIDRYEIIEDRLARGIFPIATCTADEFVIRHIVRSCEDYLADDVVFGEMPESIIKWVIEDEYDDVELPSPIGFDEARLELAGDFDIDMLFDPRFDEALASRELCAHLGIDQDMLTNPAHWVAQYERAEGT